MAASMIILDKKIKLEEKHNLYDFKKEIYDR